MAARKGFRHLTYTDRVKLEALFAVRTSRKEIARVLGCSLSTICRELQRGRYGRMGTDLVVRPAYSADIAQKDHDYKATNKGVELKIGNDLGLAEYIESRIINDKYSPAAVIADIRRNHLFETSICIKTLYNYIDNGLFLHLINQHLPRKQNKKQDYKEVQVCRIKRPLCASIEERPECIELRNEFGHWEMDTVIGKAAGKGQVLLVLTERKTRQEIIERLKAKTEHEVIKALNRLERKYKKNFSMIFKTITVDNGSEFLDFKSMETSCLKKGRRTKIYYCHPYSSWERGSNEQQNSMIRRFIPKSTKIEAYNDRELSYIEHWLNNYPRRLLNWKTSNELFAQELIALNYA